MLLIDIVKMADQQAHNALGEQVDLGLFIFLASVYYLRVDLHQVGLHLVYFSTV